MVMLSFPQLLANSLCFAAFIHYFYVTFLGYNGLWPVLPANKGKKHYTKRGVSFAMHEVGSRNFLALVFFTLPPPSAILTVCSSALHPEPAVLPCSYCRCLSRLARSHSLHFV